MALSNTELEQIYQYLITKGKKDSQLSAATLPLTGTELLAIVKSGVSVTTTINEIIAMTTFNNLYSPVITESNIQMDKSKSIFITTKNVALNLPDAKQCTGRMFFIKNVATSLTGTFGFSNEQNSANLIQRYYGGNAFQDIFNQGSTIVYDNALRKGIVSIVQSTQGPDYASLTSDKDATINFGDTIIYNMVTRVISSANVDNIYQTVDGQDITLIENTLYIKPGESLFLISDGNNWINIKGVDLTKTIDILS